MDRKYAPFLAFFAIALTAGCALFRWSGYRERDPMKVGEWSAAELAFSTSPARARPELPPPQLGDIPNTLYYSDLGPDTVDVSGYPTQQKYNYEIFRRECSACHTLARAVNSPTQSRAYWRFHMARMSLHSRVNRAGPLPAAELGFILDFLEYDSKVRKSDDKKAFEERTEELKRRFDPILKKLVDKPR